MVRADVIAGATAIDVRCRVDANAVAIGQPVVRATQNALTTHAIKIGVALFAALAAIVAVRLWVETGLITHNVGSEAAAFPGDAAFGCAVIAARTAISS